MVLFVRNREKMIAPTHPQEIEPAKFLAYRASKCCLWMVRRSRVSSWAVSRSDARERAGTQAFEKSLLLCERRSGRLPRLPRGQEISSALFAPRRPR